MNKVLLSLMLVAVLFSGCAFPLQQMPAGMISSDITVPSWYHTDSNEVGSKTGEASCGAFLGLFAAGDASVKEAARNGGISKIMTVDQNVKSFLCGLWWEMTTIVTGE